MLIFSVLKIQLPLKNGLCYACLLERLNSIRSILDEEPFDHASWEIKLEG